MTQRASFFHQYCTTTIEFSLLKAPDTLIYIIFNMMSQKVRSLVSEYMIPGVHSVVWNGRDDDGLAVSTGVYVTRLQMDDAVTTGSMMLVK
jgi:hypothetical protein